MCILDRMDDTRYWNRHEPTLSADDMQALAYAICIMTPVKRMVEPIEDEE